jgi:hypothetical protein
MYGRLVEVDGVDPARRDETLSILRERIIPGMKEIDGFAGFISLMDSERGRARNVLLWETREGAEEAERRFGPKREEIVREMGGTVRSAELFEAPIVEILAAAHAEEEVRADAARTSDPHRSTANAMLTVVRNVVIRSSDTSQLIETTSAPEIPRSVLAASVTAI